MRLILDREYELVRGPVLFTVGITADERNEFKRVEFLRNGTCTVGGVPKTYQLHVTRDEAQLIELMKENRESVLCVGFPTSMQYARYQVKEVPREVIVATWCV